MDSERILKLADHCQYYIDALKRLRATGDQAAYDAVRFDFVVEIMKDPEHVPDQGKGLFDA